MDSKNPPEPATLTIPLKGENWSEPERWVLEQLFRGEIADFHSRYGRIDANLSEGWSEQRLLRPTFLQTILVHEFFRNALPPPGVRIRGAWVTQAIDFLNANLAHEWWLEAS